MGVACLEFRGENFRGWLKNREIRESFLPRKFPAIRYNVMPRMLLLENKISCYNIIIVTIADVPVYYYTWWFLSGSI